MNAGRPYMYMYSQVREKTVVGDVIQVFSLLATGEKVLGRAV